MVFAPTLLVANPTWLGVTISEIYFDETGEWKLEINNIDMASVDQMDSLFIECNSGVAKITDFDTTDYIVVTNKNLNHPIEINKDSDLIILYSYSFGEYKTDRIAVGNYHDSYLKNIKNGQSIVRLESSGPFYKDNTPTIGTANDLIGATGKIFGYFYDTNNLLIKSKYFFIDEGYCTAILQKQGFAGNLEINNEGFYCAEITSRSYSIS